MGMGPGRHCGSRWFDASVGQLYVPQVCFFIPIPERAISVECLQEVNTSIPWCQQGVFL